MKSLSIDIETFSSASLAKSGVYRYVEAPDFEILLFGYSVDGGAAQVIDLACGDKIPADIITALTDETVTKWAFNASFERVCLSRFIGLPTGEYIDPVSWHCSMIWAATIGLPLSLEGVGAVLKLDKQKLTEGKDLIKYFCQPCTPTKVNGERTRNYTYHAPDKWSAFKKYNIRDVEAEMSIQARLIKFPVPESIWDEYHLDQEINDRGVALDIALVQEAIEIDGRSRSELTAAMKHIIIDKNTFNAAQVVLQRMEEAAKGRPRPHKSEFTGKIYCPFCGKNYKRNTCNGSVGWNCSTFLTEGKAYCHGKKIPEATLQAVCAEVLGTETYNSTIFDMQIDHIEVPEDNHLRFVFKDGSTIERTWPDRSRRESWTSEMKQAAAERTRIQRRKKQCQE